jgi:3-hydroxyacyl-CoA dehydrogenase/enoyl-CoA hydratase/3-hydroxybutyryl-CoA epimerase
MIETAGYKHWQISFDIDNICWLTLDRSGEKINSLSTEVLAELESLITAFETELPRGLVLQSGKPGSFILGADVREFEGVTDPQEAAANIRAVHNLFNRIEALQTTTVVTIEGYCLGGGLELALAFDYRIARNVDHTRLGFPEVRLGIYPGFGGSARSVQRLGGQKAMEIMLTGRMLRPGAARAMGLVDKLVGPHGEMRWAARRAVLKNQKSAKPSLLARLSNTGPARRALAGIMRKKTAAKVNPDHYSAPFELIDAWEAHGNDKAAMLEEEAVRVGRLITTDTSANLRRVFRLMDLLKSYGKSSDFKASRVHVIGAGVMGGDIAAWCVAQGLEVTLQDREQKYIEPALARAKKLFKKKLRKPAAVAAAMARLIPDVAGDGVSRADVIIEAIFENQEAKRELFKNIEPDLQPHTILATNTSAIPLDELSSVLKQPGRLVGLHFFNPVAKMPLVEIVHAANTNSTVLADAGSFCSQIGRFPLLVKSNPGFLVNRVLGPYMGQALTLHQEGISKEAIDKAATDFGMPMGPVELADTVGLDVGLNVISILGGKGAAKQKAFLQEFVDAGNLGKKSGRGFYRWRKGKPQKDSSKVHGYQLQELAHRLLKPYLDECQACLDEGIVADVDSLDAGMIFGTGFAPFRGGPMHYLQSQQNAGQQDQGGDS